MEVMEKSGSKALGIIIVILVIGLGVYGAIELASTNGGNGSDTQVAGNEAGDSASTSPQVNDDSVANDTEVDNRPDQSTPGESSDSSENVPANEPEGADDASASGAEELPSTGPSLRNGLTISMAVFASSLVLYKRHNDKSISKI